MITDGLIWLSKWTAAQVYFCCVWALQHILLPAWPYFAALLLLTAVRLFSILPARRNQTRKRTSPSPPAHLRRIGAVLGSGGHTSEMLTLLSHLDVSDGVDGEAKGATSYAPPHTYFISRGDTLSAAKARSFESNRPWTQKRATQSELQPSIVDLPRARRVHQPLLTTPFSVLECFAACLHYTLRDERTRSLDLIVMNGPGTCVPLVAAVYVKRVGSGRKEVMFGV